MELLQGLLTLIVNFLQGALNLLKALIDLVIGFLQGLLNIFF